MLNILKESRGTPNEVEEQWCFGTKKDGFAGQLETLPR